MSDTDPLLRAVADGDPHCPDGRMLAALGQLIRSHGVPPRPQADLADDVLARINDAGQADGEAIDAFYNSERTDAADEGELGRLASLVRGAAPAPIDLSQQVLKRIRASTRLALFAEEPRRGIDRSSRWRIWSAVVASHVAALLAFAIFELGFGLGTDHSTPARSEAAGAGGDAGNGSGMGTGDAGSRRAVAPALPPNLPATWGDVRSLGTDLFLLRRFPELRREALRQYGQEAAAPAIAAGLGWLLAQQDAATGAFVPAADGDERGIATHSLAVLALLGEGLGDRTRTTAARRGLAWLAERVAPAGDDAPRLAGLGPVAGGLSTLALVEGGLLLGDDDLRLRAEGCLVALDRGLPMQPGANGLGGFPLLALETAQQGGMRVPGRLLQQARKQIARALPAQEAADAGRLGLAAFARAIYGLGDASSAQQQVRRLGELAGTLAGERPDPLGWFFATLAMREAGGDAWSAWSAATASALTPLLHADAQTAAGRVDPQTIRHGDSAGERADVFATSLVLLNLQAPYRYLPLAPAAK